MKVLSSIACYEVDGREPSIPVGKTGPQIHVESHWSRATMVILKIDDRSYTLVGRELQSAIANAMNRG